MRISDWSSDVCSSDLGATLDRPKHAALPNQDASPSFSPTVTSGIRPQLSASGGRHIPIRTGARSDNLLSLPRHDKAAGRAGGLLSEGGRSGTRSEEHTSELQSLMRISYAVFCLKKKKKTQRISNQE